jgi:acetylornithine deacetylase
MNSLLEIARQNEPNYIDFLQSLLQIPAPRMQEHECIRFLEQAFERAGRPLTCFEGLGLEESMADGLPLNLFGTRNGSGGGRSLLIEAHIDTPPPGDERRWTSPPWSAMIREGRIYARGAHDDRTGAAMLWMLNDLLDKACIETKGDLHYLVTTEEECSSGGMKAFLQHPLKIVPDAHILVDGNAAINTCIIGHMNSLPFEVTFRGNWGSAQYGDPDQDSNPILSASRFLATLPEFAHSFVERWKSRSPDSRWPTPRVVPTAIHTSDWFSNIPEKCSVCFFANMAPPVAIEECQAWIEDWIESFAPESSWFQTNRPTLRWLPVLVPSYCLPESSELLKRLSRCHETVLGAPLIPRYVGGWGDMTLLGSREAIFYGPGTGGGDHSYDEYYTLEDLRPILVTLASFIKEWCNLAPLHTGSDIL